jgi:hypothetical protein
MAECAAMSAAQRLVAIVAVAILVLAGIVVLGLNVGAGGAAAEPSGTPSGSPLESPSPSGAPTDGPSPADENEVLAALAEIEEQVIAIRGLPAADIGPPDLLTRDEVREELVASFDEDYPQEERDADNATLRALGLLEADQDIADLQLQLLGDQVLGFYDDVEKRMVVVTDQGLDALARFTYAHEYAHALQDAAFGIDSLERDAEGEDDRGLARTALLEGDASVVMLAWAFEHLTPQELLEITSTPPPDTEGIPSWLVEYLVVFPYNDGLLWAGALTGDPTAPDFGALDAAYEDPPDSTEQIIDIDKWDPREDPIPVESPDLAAALGEDWTKVDDTPIGQAFLRMILEYHGVESPDARTASEGWGGDRAVTVTGPDGAFAVAWRLAWDAPQDADEFVDAYNAVIPTLGFPASVTALDGGEVLVTHASSDDILRRTIDAADD